MTFQTPVTVEEVLRGIHQKQYLLPAIQREFVWGTEQVRRLVDSLLRGYPIGSFLLWNVEPATAKEYTFYDFLTDYHERDNPFATKAAVPADLGVTAILDGQQRLTALNVAMYGSHSEKKKYAQVNAAGAYPKKRLYLNLLADPDFEELGLKYDLRFLADHEAAVQPHEPSGWFLLSDVLSLQDSGPAMTKAIEDRQIPLSGEVHQRLYDLYRAFRESKPINYYLESSQDSDKVLDIFVRVNSGGTTLSYSDLLLSMATNQWESLDAREEVRNLVHELNTGGPREFEFSKDMVLKTALMIARVDLRFRVSNFTRANMAKVEESWDSVKSSLLTAAKLLHSFGYSAKTLTADSVVIPLAYYLSCRNLADAYVNSAADGADRLIVKKWIARSLLKRGIWGSGLDTTLTRIGQAIEQSGTSSFPVEAIEAEMAPLGKSLTFDETEIDELMSLKYGGPRTFSALALLYPGLDFSMEFHQDHIFPKSRFTGKRLIEAGIAPGQVDDYRNQVNLLPNLQLLAGGPNIEKQAKMPADWLTEHFASPELRKTYIDSNDLGDVSLNLSDFLDFVVVRRTRMRERLIEVLGVENAQSV